MGQSLTSNGQAPSISNSFKSTVRALHRKLGQLAEAATERPNDVLASGLLEMRIRRLQRLRASRDRIFGKGLFGEPAWDILLDLYAAQLRSRQESVASVCVAAGVPSSTAVRWIKILLNEGLVLRLSDTRDEYRCLLALTPKGVEAMERFCNQSDFVNGV